MDLDNSDTILNFPGYYLNHLHLLFEEFPQIFYPNQLLLQNDHCLKLQILPMDNLEIGSLWAACGIDSEWRRLTAVALCRPGPEIAVDDIDASQFLHNNKSPSTAAVKKATGRKLKQKQQELQTSSSTPPPTSGSSSNNDRLSANALLILSGDKKSSRNFL